MKILCFTPLPYGDGSGWWGRDLGLTVRAFRQLGHDAQLVCYPTNHSKDPLDRPVQLITQSQSTSRDWWIQQSPDLVILGLWTRPKYDPVRRAALSATPHVIERADSDGMRTASCGLLTYAKRRFDYFRDRTYHWPSLISIPVSIFYSFASIIATPWIEFRLRKTLGLLPSIVVETPHATSLWKSLATRLGADPEKIHCIPHPIQTDIFKLNPAVSQKNQIISVGRWDSYQKNLPLLLKSLRAFLDQNPTWTSLVIGSGLPAKSPHPKIIFLPPTDPTQLARLMQESKIFLSSSRYESFGLAASEAVSCGCTSYGPPSLKFLEYFHPLRELSKTTSRGIAPDKALRSNQNISISGKTTGKTPTVFSPCSTAQQFLTVFKTLDK